MNYKISKVVLSMGCGGKTVKEINDIKSHFDGLFFRHAVTNKNECAFI